MLIEELNNGRSGKVLTDRSESTDVAEQDGDLLLNAAEIMAVMDETMGDGGIRDGAEHRTVAVMESEVRGHIVEGRREQADLVMGFDGNSEVVISGGDLMGGVGEIADGA
jgi:hypothetical protein